MKRSEPIDVAHLFAYDSGWPAGRATTREPHRPPGMRLGRGLFASALVIVAVTAGLLVADPLGASVNTRAATALGPLDEIVVGTSGTALTAPPIDAAAIDRSPGDDPFASLDGAVAARLATVTARRTLGHPQIADLRLVALDADDASRLGGQPEATGLMSVCGIGPGQVAINEPTAAALGVLPGDHLLVTVAGRELDLFVSEVVPAVGIAGYGDLLVAPATIEDPLQPVVLISNRGDVLGGAELTEAASAQLVAHFGDEVVIDAVKLDLLADAQRTSRSFALGGGLILGALAAVALLLLPQRA